MLKSGSDWRAMLLCISRYRTLPTAHRSALARSTCRGLHVGTSTVYGHLGVGYGCSHWRAMRTVRCFFDRADMGSLFKNLASIKTPFILIRNIDNVVPARYMAERNAEQQVLLGRCSQLVTERDTLLSRPDRGEPSWCQDAMDWLTAFDAHAADSSDGDALGAQLDRPLRVAGMVLNEGAPGGGPFWIQQANGRSVPSIVESVELPSGGLTGGTHFNPGGHCLQHPAMGRFAV